MLACVFWHWARAGVAPAVYEAAQRAFHAALASHAVDLGEDGGDLRDADQLQNVEMLERLRTRAVIRGEDEEHPVDRQDAREHVWEKPLVSRDIDKADVGSVFEPEIGEAEIDRHAAPLFFGQAVGVDAGQRAP